MNNEQYNRLQIIFLVAGYIGTCIAFLVGIRNGVDNIVTQQRHETKLEFKKAILTEQLATYKDACNAVGTIINLAETHDPDLPGGINEFEKIYFGKMGLVDDSVVVNAGKAFRFRCKDFQRSDKGEQAINELKHVGINFTEACKRSAKWQWDQILNK